MTYWINGPIQLHNSANFDLPNDDVVIVGELTSKYDISINARNFVLIGSVQSAGNISVKTSACFFKGGHVSASKGVNVDSGESVFAGQSSNVIDRLKKISDDFIVDLGGRITVKNY